MDTASRLVLLGQDASDGIANCHRSHSIGTVAFGLFRWLLEQGFTLEQARNHTLLLMVLFENVHVFNCRSETLSAFRHNPLRNKLLLGGTLVAQGVHIGAMHTPWLGDVLGASPVSLEQWASLLVLALSVLVVMEIHKWLHLLAARRRAARRATL